LSKTSRWKGAKDNRAGGPFLALPFVVLESAAYRSLTARGAKLFLDLLSQYRGNNNGDLSAAWKLMKPMGWKSEATLNEAKKELLSSGLLVETRMGARPNKASLYAFTFYGLDESTKLEMTRRTFPYGGWRLKDPPPPIGRKNASLTTETVVEATG